MGLYNLRPFLSEKMGAYLLKKIFILLVPLLLVSVVIFAVLMVIPSDPPQFVLGIHATPEPLQALRHKMGLDRPVIHQYLSTIKNMITGDLGRSITYDVSISSLILTRLQVTVPLAILSMTFAILLSIPIGIYSALHRNRMGDYGVVVFSQIGLAVPAFWAGILFILLFAVELRWFAAGGFQPWAETPWGAFKSLLLPALSLGLIRAAVLTRLTRSSMLE